MQKKVSVTKTVISGGKKVTTTETVVTSGGKTVITKKTTTTTSGGSNPMSNPDPTKGRMLAMGEDEAFPQDFKVDFGSDKGDLSSQLEAKMQAMMAGMGMGETGNAEVEEAAAPPVPHPKPPQRAAPAPAPAPASGTAAKPGLKPKPQASGQRGPAAPTTKPKPSAPSAPKPKPAQSAPSKPVSASELPKAVLAEQNLARTKPKEYAQKVREILSYFKGSVIHFPGNPVGLMTNEGPAAYKETISFLESCKPLPPMTWSEGLAKAAQDHANDIGPKGITGHTGSDGSSMSDRIGRYGSWGGGAGENVSFGHNTPSAIVIQLMVDDGVPSRGHRKNMFSDSFKVCGIGTGPHKGFKDCCVLDYAVTYTNK